MTYEEFWAKYIELKNGVDDFLRDRAIHILKSGAIDLAGWGDDYRLPKVVLTNALRECAAQYAPHSKEGRETLENMKHF